MWNETNPILKTSFDAFQLTFGSFTLNHRQVEGKGESSEQEDILAGLRGTNLKNLVMRKNLSWRVLELSC